MARVPLYNNGAVPSNQTGVRVPIVAQNVTAGPAVGQALVGLGALGAQVAAHVREADDSRGLLDASGIQSNYAAKQQLFQDQNPDQNTWLPQWQKHQQEMQTELAKLDLSDSARKTLDISANRWAEGQGITVERQAVKQSANRALTAADTAMGKASSAGDAQGIYSTAALIPDAVLTPESKDALVSSHLQKAQDVNRQKEFDNGLSIAQTNPREAMSWATAKKEAGQFTTRQEMMIHDAAESQMQRNRAGLLKNWSDRTSLGTPPTKEELDRAQDVTELDKQLIIHQALSKPTNDPAAYEKAYTLAATYDIVQDPNGLKRAQIEAAMTASFSGPYLDGLKAKLDERAKPRDPAKIDDGPALDMLNTWVEGGGLGSYKTPSLDADGKPIFKKKEGPYTYDPDKGFSWFGLSKEGGYNQGLDAFEAQFIEDPAKKAGAAAKQAEIRRKLQDELKIPDRFKTSDEVTARMLQLYQQAGGVAQAPVNPLLPPLDREKTSIVPNAADEGVKKALKILNN